MNAWNRSSLSFLLVTSALGLTASGLGVGCSSGVSPLAKEQSTAQSATSTPAACDGKACGTDCSPAGSDEPFNCNAAGACVATGQPLGCTEPANPCAGKRCGVDCSPAGSDEPFSCNAASACVPTPVENDCKKCPEFLGDCIEGQLPADRDGDGCIDGCK